MRQLTTFRTVDSLQSYLISVRGDSTVGFVPTMGALHEGHLSLVEKAFELCDIVVVSIFVNPKQFNNATDLEKYPRNVEADIELLSKVGNVIVFIPSVEEVYPADYIETKLDLGGIATTMEGEFRPGHFDGVVNVVKRLFDIVLPSIAFFGKKDFQQLAVINKMVRDLDLNVTIYPAEIYRETSGLASSSRNMRLNAEELKYATLIYDVLSKCKEMRATHTLAEAKKQAIDTMNNSKFDLEYFEIADPDTLEALDEWKPGAHAFVAASLSGVRLIDNMTLG